MDLTLSPKGRFSHFGKWNWDGHDKCGYKCPLFSAILDRKHGQFQMILKPRTSSLRTIVLSYDSLTELQCDGATEILTSKNISKAEFAVVGTFFTNRFPSLRIFVNKKVGIR